MGTYLVLRRGISEYQLYEMLGDIRGKDSGLRIYSESKVSDFINSITRDQSLAFLDRWNDKQDHREKIYISYDSTNKNCQAGDIDFTEYRHPKEDISAPVINYSVAYDRSNKNTVL